jgi:gentisate 1,2-dioxygenase
MHDEGPMADGEARLALKSELESHHIHIHQPDDPPLFSGVPVSPMKPVHWKWTDLKRLLTKIGEALGIDSGGNRRTLRLANPGLPFGTTPTFWCSIQYILPGEHAGAHRHQANAMRYIIEGNGARSAVDGEEYAFGEGDLVLTPNWSWHDHTHDGKEPMIWLDVLDISLVRSLHATFFQPHPTGTQEVRNHPLASYQQWGSGLMRPVNPIDLNRSNPLLAYQWATTKAAVEAASGLPADPFDDTAMEYQNPSDGGPVVDTLSVRMLRMRPGFEGKARRQTGSKVYHIVAGKGETTVNGQTFRWEKNDFISVPPWALHTHRIASDAGPALLLEINDHPTLKALGFFRQDHTGN